MSLDKHDLKPKNLRCVVVPDRELICSQIDIHLKNRAEKAVLIRTVKWM